MTGGRTIRKGGSRSSSQAPRSHRQSVPLLEFLENVLKFSKALLRQKDSPLRQDMPCLDVNDSLDTSEEQVADSGTDHMNGLNISDQTSQEWTVTCDAIRMEMNRLVMWKCDVVQRKLTPALKAESPVYSIICESILGIGGILQSLTSTQFIASSDDPNLRMLYKTLDNSIGHIRSQPNSTTSIERPSANTRLQKLAVEGFYEGSVLKSLRSDVNRLLHLVDTMAVVARTIDATT